MRCVCLTEGVKSQKSAKQQGHLLSLFACFPQLIISEICGIRSCPGHPFIRCFSVLSLIRMSATILQRTSLISLRISLLQKQTSGAGKMIAPTSYCSLLFCFFSPSHLVNNVGLSPSVSSSQNAESSVYVSMRKTEERVTDGDGSS